MQAYHHDHSCSCCAREHCWAEDQPGPAGQGFVIRYQRRAESVAARVCGQRKSMDRYTAICARELLAAGFDPGRVRLCYSAMPVIADLAVPGSAESSGAACRYAERAR